MNKNQSNAFPQDSHWTPGLTKREYFAVQALKGLLAALGHQEAAAVLAWQAVKAADALLAELEK